MSANRRTRRSVLRLEELESSWAPATLVNSTTIAYQDVDGDDVKVVLSKPVLTSAAVASSVFQFDFGSVNGANLAQQLQAINLIDLPTPANAAGTTITITATRNAVRGGDGFANVGEINAQNLPLGQVTIHGDLGKILVGQGPMNGPQLTGLKVNSIGRFGTSPQAAGGDLSSFIDGAVTSLNVASDILGAEIHAVSFGTVTIGGSLLGSSATDGGRINSDGDIGSVRMGGSIVGGAGQDSGEIHSGGKIANIGVGGSVVGGGGLQSGRIDAVKIGTVIVGIDLRGGVNDHSGEINAGAGGISGVTVNGSLIGSGGISAGTIVSAGAMGNIKVNGSMRGGAGADSGSVEGKNTISGVTLGGSLIGGGGSDSGEIVSSSDMGNLVVGGSFIGGVGSLSGGVDGGGKLGNVKVGGSLVGGRQVDTGEIFAHGDIGMIAIGGDLRGSAFVSSGDINTLGNIVGVSVAGSLVGGTGGDSGEIHAGGNIGNVTVGGDLHGDNSSHTGDIDSGGTLGRVTIKGSLIGGSGSDSGEILSVNDMGAVIVGGDFIGSSGDDSGAINAGGTLAGVTVGGSLIGGSGSDTGEILAGGDTGTITINGFVQGAGGSNSGDVSIAGKLTGIKVAGSVIGGGGGASGTIFSTGDMGAVTIGGDVVGSSISGTALSINQTGYVQGQRIASITIGGSLVAGSNNSTNGAKLTHDGSIQAVNDIGLVTIKGDVAGDATNPAVISGRGQAGLSMTATTDLAIGAVTIAGRVEWANILAGYDVSGAAVNGQASIGAVKVGLDWIASNLVAGVQAGSAAGFGTGADTEIGPEASPDRTAKIASITIGGAAMGTIGGAEHFGFVAEQIGSFSDGGTTFTLHAGANNDGPLSVGATGDLDLFEVP
jgi:hypothetical protein